MPGTAGGYVETLIADKWLYSELSGDASLTAMLGVYPQQIWHHLASEQAVWPFIVFNLQGERDVIGIGGARIMTEMIYSVRVIGEIAALSTLRPIARQIDLLLHNSTGVTEDGTVMACVRQSPLETAELRAGKQWLGVGGLYKIWCQ